MYRKNNRDQQNYLDDFYLPFSGKLDTNNRWVIMAGLMPWDFIEDKYAEAFANERPDGRIPYPARLAFGSIYIKEHENLTDQGTVDAIAENPYMQYFLGYAGFETGRLFDPSTMCYFRRRFPAEIVNEVNEEIHRRKAKPPEPPENGGNKGLLILDATVAPADIRYPNDVSLLNECRENLEAAIEDCWKLKEKHAGHKLPYVAKKARSHYLAFAKRKNHGKGKAFKAIRKQLGYVMLAMERLDEFLSDGTIILTERFKERLEVIKEVARQQQEMIDEHKRSVADRIVSLRQPHVRPIIRGKTRTPVEFGQKISTAVVDGFTFIHKQSFDNFNEGISLKDNALEYFERFGFLPEAIIVDQIYRNRDNIKFCKANGIRLSGPPLGRKKEGAEEKECAQAYEDSCIRNIVESRNGIAKRRFGLDLIMSRGEENAMTEAALNVLAMNLSHLMRLFSCLFANIRALFAFLLDISPFFVPKYACA